MNITFLGTGTSHGVPMIGCDCEVCTSDNIKNKRTRCSVLIEESGVNILIDTPPDFRLQVIRENIRRIDAVLFTHAHADHIFGLDDIRRFNDMSKLSMPCYSTEMTLSIIKKTFEYIFTHTQKGGGKPSLELIPVEDKFRIKGIKVTPIPVKHGKVDVLGYRIKDFAYVTDLNLMPESSVELLQGLDMLVLGAVRHKSHTTHISVSEALEIVDILKPGKTYFTHISHRLDHDKTNEELPDNVELSYDGLRIDL